MSDDDFAIDDAEWGEPEPIHVRRRSRRDRTLRDELIKSLNSDEWLIRHLGIAAHAGDVVDTLLPVIDAWNSREFAPVPEDEYETREHRAELESELHELPVVDAEIRLMDVPVTIERDHLEILLSFAKIGDVAASQRRWRNGFRHVPICSDGSEPECVSCQAFAGAMKALDTSADEDEAFWERLAGEVQADPPTSVDYPETPEEEW